MSSKELACKCKRMENEFEGMAGNTGFTTPYTFKHPQKNKKKIK